MAIREIRDITATVDSDTAAADAKVLLVTPTGVQDQVITVEEFDVLLANRGFDAKAWWGQVVNIEDYGAVPASRATGVNTEQEAANNATAIEDAYQAAFSAAHAITHSTSSVGNKLGGSINRYAFPRLVFPGGHYQISRPVQLPHQGGVVGFDGQGVCISRYGLEGVFETNWPGRWAIEFGDDVNANTVPMFMIVSDMTFAGFRRPLRLGIAPNNMNLSMWVIRDCHFAGPATGHPDSCAVRIFNRSGSVTFYNCEWNLFERAVEAQSIDRLVFKGCRDQVGNQILDGSTTRPANDAQFVLYHTRCNVSNQIGNPPHLTGGIANIETTQRYFWYWMRDFDPWIANSRYLKGDCIYQSWTGTEDSKRVYWARMNYTADAGVTWSTDRANWRVIDAMGDWKSGEVLTGDEIRRAGDPDDLVGGSPVWKFWHNTAGARTTIAGNVFTAGEKANWEIIADSGDAATGYGSGPFANRRDAGEPISAWNDLHIDQQGLYGAESGGFPLVLWDVPERVNPATTRKLGTKLTVRDCTTQSNVSFRDMAQPLSYDGSTTKYQPMVLLRQVPNFMRIIDNELNDVTGSCVAFWDPTLATSPGYLPTIKPMTSNRMKNARYVDVHGNINGGIGLTAFAAQPWPNSWQYLGPNYVPEDLSAQIFLQKYSTVTAGALLANVPAWEPSGVFTGSITNGDMTVDSVTSGALRVGDQITGNSATGGTYILSQTSGTPGGAGVYAVTPWQTRSTGTMTSNKHYRVGDVVRATDPAGGGEKLFRSRFNRRSSAITTFTASERFYWELASDIESDAVAGGPWIAPVVNCGNFYLACNPVPIKIAGFVGMAPGQEITIFHSNSNTLYRPSPEDFTALKHTTTDDNTEVLTGTPPIVLTQSADFSAPTNGVITFKNINGRAVEINRNY